jgi:hypothetical protein
MFVGDPGVSLSGLSAAFSGGTLLIGLRIVFLAGRLLQRVDDHDKRIDRIEDKLQ